MILHPVFVHFPIALLTVYAVLECLRFKQIWSWAPLFYIKATLVIFGSLGAAAAYLSGSAIEDTFGNDARLNHIVEVHSQWATITFIIFGFLALCYLVAWMGRSRRLIFSTPTSFIQRMWALKVRTANAILSSPLSLCLAIIGLVTVTVTGALGGSLVYGSNVDPLVSLIYALLKLPKL